MDSSVTEGTSCSVLRSVTICRRQKQSRQCPSHLDVFQTQLTAEAVEGEQKEREQNREQVQRGRDVGKPGREANLARLEVVGFERGREGAERLQSGVGRDICARRRDERQYEREDCQHGGEDLEAPR